MHAVRSLVVLLMAATAASAQAPKAEPPQAAITARLVTIHWSETPTFVKLISSSNLLSPAKVGQPGLPEVLKALEGYKTATITSMPKATILSGETGDILVGKTKTVITGFDKAGDPITEAVHDGTQIKLKVAVKAGGKEVEIDVDAKHTVVNENVPLTPVTQFVKPTADSPADAPLVPFTTFHLKPDVQTVKHAGIFSYPNGGSHIWDLGTFSFQVDHPAKPTLVSRVPYLNRLFKGKTTTEKYQAYLILTADVVAAK